MSRDRLLADLIRPVRIVLRMDLETLRRRPESWRIALFNRIEENFNRYLEELAPDMDPNKDRVLRGEFLFAQLLIAASFRVNGEDIPEITGLFSEEEYRLVIDLEELKEIDYFSVEALVERIERREGKVYELVKKYYERQYYLIDREWTNIMGDLALVAEKRYKSRREKLEQAVLEYLRKRPLSIFVSEIEDAAIRAYEARKSRLEAEKLARQLAEKLEGVEAIVAPAGGGQGDPLSLVEEALQRAENLQGIVAMLEAARRELERKERELRLLAEKYQEAEAAEEILRSEAEELRRRVEELQGVLDEYRALVDRLRAERDALREKLEGLEAAIRGEAEGHLVSAEEAWALEQSLVQRVIRHAVDGALIYDPRRGERRRISWEKPRYYQASPGTRPSGMGVELVSLRGVVRRKRDVVLDAASIVHVDAYREQGYDSAPVSLAEVLEHLEPRLGEASAEDSYVVLIIGSPTGFTRKAVEYVESGRIPGLAPRNATIYLVDPVAGKIYYNRDDPAAAANRFLAELWLDEEKLGRAIRYLKSREAMKRAVVNSPASPFLTSEEVAEATGLDLETVRRAFYRLEEEGEGRVVVVEGRVAFVYRRGAGA